MIDRGSGRRQISASWLVHQGRAGFVLFYQPNYYLANPREFLKPRQPDAKRRRVIGRKQEKGGARMNRSLELENSEPSTLRAMLDGRGAFLGFLVKRLGNLADAEDVLQEFCIRVLARKDQLRDVERMNAWLFAILRSSLNDHYRNKARRTRLTDAVAREPEEWIADAPTQMARLCTCHGGLIAELRGADAELIRRIDFGEENRGSVAADLGLSLNALGVRLHRARSALREALMNHCGECCREGRDDCSCPPEGCANDRQVTNCKFDERDS